MKRKLEFREGDKASVFRIETTIPAFGWVFILEPKGAEPALQPSTYTFNPKHLNSRTFTIKEASRKANVSTHTLRYWEKILEGIVVPLRTPGGQRRYTRDHLLLLEEIKRLKRKGFTLADIRGELSQSVAVEKLDPDSPTLEHLANHIAEAVRTTIYSFFQGKNGD